MACLQAGLFFPTQDGRPPTCGTFPYTGPAFCYRQPYTPDICTFHLCPGFLVEPTSGKGKLSSEDESKPTLDLDTETFQGGECSSILDWYCCACQFCPNCLM